MLEGAVLPGPRRERVERQRTRLHVKFNVTELTRYPHLFYFSRFCHEVTFNYLFFLVYVFTKVIKK